MRFRWVRFHIEISKVTGPNFTGLVSPNAGGIAIDGMTIRFWISSSVSAIFAAELRSRPKSGQILHVFRPRNFFGEGPPKKILDRHYKIRPSTDHRAKFRAGRPTHLGDLALNKKTSCVKHKSFRKLSFSGGLKNKKESFYATPCILLFACQCYVIQLMQCVTLADKHGNVDVSCRHVGERRPIQLLFIW